MKKQTIRLLLVISFALPAAVLAQGGYTHGHGALQLFDSKGLENTPLWVKVWITFMAATFAVGLLFVKNHVIARWVVGGFILGLIVTQSSSKVFGIPPFSGYIALMHLIFWSPGLYQLLSKRPFLGTSSAFSTWSGVMAAVIIFSFIFDLRDAFIFLQHVFGGGSFTVVG